MVTFYIGCSFSFEDLLLSYEIPVRNIEQKKNVTMFKVNINLLLSLYAVVAVNLPIAKCNQLY